MSWAGIKDKHGQLIEIESLPNNAVQAVNHQPSSIHRHPTVKVILIEAADAAVSNTARRILSTPCLHPLRVIQAISKITTNNVRRDESSKLPASFLAVLLASIGAT